MDAGGDVLEVLGDVVSCPLGVDGDAGTASDSHDFTKVDGRSGSNGWVDFCGCD